MLGAASPSVSVVIPVYNSDATLPELARRLESVLADRGAPFEVILVDDDSTTQAWAVIEDLAKTRPWLRGLRLLRNYGQHNALLCGIRDARHAIVVTLDDDLQHRPEEIPRLLARLEQGFDVVYGTPAREQHGPWRDLASRLTKLALRGALGAENARHVSAFRAFRTELRQAFEDYRSPFLSLDVLLAWASTRFSAVAVEHDPRRSGPSGYTLRKLLLHALNMATGFSTWPLQLASLIGFVFTLFGGLTLAYVIGRYLIQGAVVPGFAFLASIIAIFSGAQLFCLGILGEYLARMHYRSMERPPYAVRCRTAEHASR
jgi:undecaprenyl-phosphate 4-deoxy-4-formamido-L-arabinose transferase